MKTVKTTSSSTMAGTSVATGESRPVDAGQVSPLRGAVLVAVLLGAMSQGYCRAGAAPDARRVTVVFRLDDYAETSNTEMELKVIEAFREHGFSCTFGIIPFVCKGSVHDSRDQGVIPLSQAKGDILKEAVEAGAVELALHGYAHQTIRDTGGWTEFIGLDYEAQRLKLKKGKDFLEELLGLPVTIFVPPWNSYDADTTRALESLGFKCLSAATFGSGEVPSALKLLPATCDLPELRDAIETARRGPDADPLIVALFHNYDFVEHSQIQGIMTYRDLIGLLGWVAAQPDVEVRSMSDVVDSDIDLSGSRLTANGAFGQWPDYVPPFMPDLVGVPTGVYLSTAAVDSLSGTKSRLYIGTGLFYLFLVMVPAVILFIAGRMVCSRSAPLARFLKYVVLLLLAAALAYGGRNLQIGYRGALAIFGLLGVCAGVWTSAWVEARRCRIARTT